MGFDSKCDFTYCLAGAFPLPLDMGYLLKVAPAPSSHRSSWSWSRPEADCGLDHELLTAKFRLKVKKVGETTRPFRYDLNQIPYNYTVKVGNRFKGLDLKDRVPEELWTEVYDTIQEAVIKSIPEKKNVKRQNVCLRRPYKQL